MDANMLTKPPELSPGFEPTPEENTDEVQIKYDIDAEPKEEIKQDDENQPKATSTPTAQKLKNKGKSAKKATDVKMTASDVREIQTSIAEK